jgi:hypothetical protein
VSAPAPSPEAIRPTGRPGRGAKTLGDMIRSLVFVLLSVFVLFGGFLFVAYRYHGSSPHPQRVDADVAMTLTTARAQAPYHLVAPAGLAQAWAPTSVSWSNDSPSVLQIGYVTPSAKFLDFVETNGPADALLSVYEKAPVASAGTAVVAGRTYDVRRDADGNLSYVGRGTPAIGVGGGATKAEIEQFLATLR